MAALTRRPGLVCPRASLHRPLDRSVNEFTRSA